jgi:predicted MPP superfamily phosphohydrolase
VRARFVVFVAIIQSTLFLAHWFVYETWSDFWGTSDPPGISKLQVALALLSVSFVTASLLAFRYAHILVRLFYKISAAWLGVLSCCFFAACSCRILYDLVRLLGLHGDRRAFAVALFGLAILASLYGVVNAAWVRVKRITVKLPNLPESWRGRLAALVSDTHLGHVRGRGFVRRIVTMLMRLRPDIVFITGDLFDGTAADLRRLTEPWMELSAPLGAYFVTGNHEEFSDHTKYLDAVKRAGVRVLNNEKVTLDGLQVVGVHYRDSLDAQRFRSILRQAALDHDRASILLTHAPDRLPIAEEEGISLQLSGHTHGGQIFPFTWITSLLYGRYAYGLNRLGTLAVYTSSGAGTWGPPMRVGTRPEIVLIRFE